MQFLFIRKVLALTKITIMFVLSEIILKATMKLHSNTEFQLKKYFAFFFVTINKIRGYDC